MSITSVAALTLPAVTDDSAQVKATTSTAADATVSGSVTLDGNLPGGDNIFSFELLDSSNSVKAKTVNDEYGNFSFNLASLDNGTYSVRQVTTDAEKQKHVNIVLDESNSSVTLSGEKSTTGVDWLINGNLYMATGGPPSDNPIKAWKSDNSEFVYAYCLNNRLQAPDDFWNNKAQYKAVIPSPSLTSYAQLKSKADTEGIRKVVYHYTVNPPKTNAEWDNVEKIISYLASGTTIGGDQPALLTKCLQETVPSNFVLVLLTPYGNNKSYYSTSSDGGYDSGLQNLITGYIVGNRKISPKNVAFANTTYVPPIPDPVNVSISASKTLDGNAPGEDNIFSFELLNGEDTVIQTKQNNAAGDIVFDEISFNEAGTYTYKIREVNDGRSGIEFDTETKTVNITVTEADGPVLNADFTKVSFNNKTVAPIVPAATESVSVVIKATKTLDGNVPGNGNIFSFELRDENKNLLQTKQNDSAGNIVFDAIDLDAAGTYTYTIQEINDGKGGIEYDTAVKTVTVTVAETTDTEGTDFDFTADYYYGMTTKDALYISKTIQGTDLQVYCIDADKMEPPLSSDLADGSDTTKYSVVQDPSNDVLEGYVGTVHDNGNTKENLRKLMYYLDKHPELKHGEKANLVWAASSHTYNNASEYEAKLEAILAETSVPDNYHLAVFYPSQLDGTDHYDSLDEYQPLLAGYYSGNAELSAQCTTCQFDNKTAPVAGGITAYLDVSKTLNGGVPGVDHTFTFKLFENGAEIATAQNDAEGKINFPARHYTEAGTHTYTIAEVNDGQEGIEYDTNSYTATVTLYDKDFYDLDADTYYSSRDTVGYYTSKNLGGTDFPVYDLRASGTGTINVGGNTEYLAIKDPDIDTLTAYVDKNRYGDALTDNLRKLLYYSEVRGFSNTDMSTYIYMSTHYFNGIEYYDETLNEMYSHNIPEDYHLILFVPKNYDGTRTSNDPLIGGYGPKISYSSGDSIVLSNKTVDHSGYELPDTGGPGTDLITITGLLITAAPIIYIVFKRFKYNKGEE